MKLSNELSVLASRRRWTKRLFSNFLPEVSNIRIFDRINFHYDPRDMKGPSFHFGYDLEKGFLNYEQIARDELLTRLPENGVLYDIGANIGLYSIYVAYKRNDVKIFGFEPDTTVYNCIKETIKSFPNDQIKILNKGVGFVTEKKKLFHSTVNDGGHSFVAQGDEVEKQYGDFEVVDVINLDEYRKENNLALPDAVKIDVEGFELEVLKGMKATIEEAAPDMLIEASNIDISKKGELWNFMNSLSGIEVVAHRPGSSSLVSLDELAEVAQKEIDNGVLVSNYFFYLSKK